MPSAAGCRCCSTSTGATSFEALAKQTGAEMGKASELAAEARDLMLRLPEFVEPRYLCAVEIADSLEARPASNAQLELVIVRKRATAGKAALAYDPACFDDATATRAARQLSSWLKHLARRGQPAHRQDRPGRRRRAQAPDRRVQPDGDGLPARQVRAPAVRGPGGPHARTRWPWSTPVASLSYAELNARANRLAHALIAAGAGPNKMIGLCVERSEELVIGALAIQKAGAGYLPLDPAYPQDRIAFMAEDSGASLDRLPAGDRRSAGRRQGQAGVHRRRSGGDRRAVGPATRRWRFAPEHLAYCIYTSGSTGKPKGVLIEHRQVVNFFTGMDAHIDGQQGKTWLAVTSLSFDISVLELFWTLGRGFKIVLAGEDRSYLESKRSGASRRPVDFSLFYFASDEDPTPGPEKYRLLIEGAKFADDNGFAAVWTPERHFGAFGGIYPNPAVAGAAIAMITKRVQIRAGSCVVPLHHPARITEEWSVVDNLSNGRVAISFATGWHPKDFLLKPENYKDRREATLADIETIRKLWRGEEVSFDSPIGPTAVMTRPRPVQKDLPIWFTAAGNPANVRDRREDRGQHPDPPAGAVGPGSGRQDRRLPQGLEGRRTPGRGQGDADAAHLRRRRRRRGEAHGARPDEGLPAQLGRADRRARLELPGVQEGGQPEGKPGAELQEAVAAGHGRPARVFVRAVLRGVQPVRYARDLHEADRPAEGAGGGRDRLPDRLRGARPTTCWACCRR